MALLLLDKLKKDINILFGYVRCLMAKSDEDCPLVATEWSANHSTVTGNPYTAGTYVFWNGHVYKCKFDNDGLPPNNTTYWLDLGEGHLLAEEQSDWNATGGRRYILNKPTKTSDFFNDGEDGSSPYATMNDVNAAIASPQDIDSVLGEGDTAPDKDINVQSVGLWDNFTAPFGFARITANKSRINFISKIGIAMGYISQGSLSLLQGAFSFTINLPTLTSNRVATFQDKSGVVAYLSDITGAGTEIDPVFTAWLATNPLNPYFISPSGTPTNNQLMVYNTTLSVWEYKAISDILGYTPYRYLNSTQVLYAGSTLGSAIVIGLTETIVSQTTILGGTFSTSDLMKVFYKCIKPITLSTVTMRIRVNTTNTLVGATQISILGFLGNNTYALENRNINLSSGLGFSYNSASAVAGDINNTNTAGTSFTYDTTNDLYVFFTIQFGNLSDSATFQLASISN